MVEGGHGRPQQDTVEGRKPSGDRLNQLFPVMGELALRDSARWSLTKGRRNEVDFPLQFIAYSLNGSRLDRTLSHFICPGRDSGNVPRSDFGGLRDEAGTMADPEEAEDESHRDLHHAPDPAQAFALE